MEQRCPRAFQCNSQRLCNLMAPLVQNVREDPQIAPWNTCNNNTEFDEGQQNMMSFSYMKALYECTRLPP